MGDESMSLGQWSAGTSSALFGEFNEESLDACREAGIDSIEIVVSRRDPNHGRDNGPLAAKAAELGIDVWSVHLPFGHPWDISSLERSVRDQAIEWNIGILERAVTWGAKKAIIHPSFEPIPDEERQERLKLCADSLKTLGEQASQMGIQIAVECLPRTCLGNTSEEILTLLEAHPSLGVCCDVNHLLHETPEEFIARVGQHIVTLHISDYDGVDERHWIPGRGVIDWNAVLGELLKADYDGPFMFEVSRKGDDKPVTPKSLMQCWQGLVSAFEAQD